MTRPHLYPNDPLVAFTLLIKSSQKKDLRLLATYEIEMAEHIRRAIDIYLSQPAIQAALVELKKKPEATELAPTDVAPFPCSHPNLDKHCSGCTDERSQGTHRGCTIEHGHVACSLAERELEGDSGGDV